MVNPETQPVLEEEKSVAKATTLIIVNQTVIEGFDYQIDFGFNQTELDSAIGFGLEGNLSGMTFAGNGTNGTIEKVDGYTTNCALYGNGSVACWGNNQFGTVGYNSSGQNVLNPTLVQFPAGRYAVDLAVGWFHACAAMDNGSVMCWGGNNLGQLGVGNYTTNWNATSPVYVAGNVSVNATGIAAAKHSSCATYDDGSVRCWGKNEAGQLGLNNTTSVYQPTLSTSLSNIGIEDIVLGKSHSCSIATNGSVYCLGSNNGGQIGTGTWDEGNFLTPSFVDLDGGAMALSLGQMRSCALMANYQLYCWGMNNYGQIDPSSPIYNYISPYHVSNNVISVSASPGQHTCYVVANFNQNSSKTTCVGLNNYGESGANPESWVGDANNDVIPSNITNSAEKVFTGYYTSCATKYDKSLHCWGWNPSGQLGFGNTTGTTAFPSPVHVMNASMYDPATKGKMLGKPETPEDPNANTTVVAVLTMPANYSMPNSAGFDIMNGNNANKLKKGVNVKVVKALNYTINGSTINKNGVIELNSFRLNITPVVTGGPYTIRTSPSLPSFASIDDTNGTITATAIPPGGYSHHYVIHAKLDKGKNSAFPVWINFNSSSALSNESMKQGIYGSFTSSLPAYIIENATSLTTIGSVPGLSHSSGKWSGVPTTPGKYSVVLWANNSTSKIKTQIDITVDSYDIGSISASQESINLTKGIQMSPLTINNNLSSMKWAQVSTNGKHSCGYLENGSVYCWGHNPNGQVDPSSTTNALSPKHIDLGSSSPIQISVSYRTSCVLLSNQSSACWGLNADGQLLGGHSNSVSSPVFKELSGAVKLVTQSFSTCILFESGSVSCAGENSDGELGLGNTTNSQELIEVSLYTDAVDLIATLHTSCALLTTGDLQCWGRNNKGQVGVGTTTDVLSPTNISTGSGTIVDMGVGNDHMCVLKSTGTVLCWGDNQYGEVGVGNTNIQNSPQTIQLPSGSTPSKIFVGSDASCAQLENGSVYCWGANANGQMLLPTNTDTTSPNYVATFSSIDIKELLFGTIYSHVFDDSGNLSSGGSGADGGTGLGNTTTQTTLVQLARHDWDISWEVYPSLPSGLTLDTTSGISIKGTPSIIDEDGETYTIYANASLGAATISETTEVIIRVYDQQVTGVTPSSTSATLTKGVSMTAITMQTTGGTPTSWTITPQLSSGLNFNTQNGTISGIPSTLDTSSTTYQVNASNGNGGASASVTITINDQAPDISLTTTSYTFTKGTAIADISFTNAGGSATSWTVSPSLVGGLSIDSSTGVISGTPNVLDTTGTTYTVTVSNSGGQDTATLTIVVNDIAPSLTASELFNSFTNGTAITPITFTNDGGSATSWTIWPSLSSGLSFDSSTGTISGTPTTVDVSGTNYYVNATNSGGSDSEVVEIKITEEPISSLTPSATSVTLTKGVAMQTITMSTSGVVTTWAISPSLPNGLTFDTSSGSISGTPTTLDTSGTNYTVTASNSGGSISAVVHITIIEAAPSGLTPSSTSVTLTKGQAMSPITMSISGGPVDTWSVSPSLPSGLSMNSSTGTISGVPTVLDTTGTTYTVTASNSGGSAQATISITILHEAPSSLSASDTYVTLTNGTAMTDITFNANGATITSWSISPSLVSGLSFSSSDGTISGTPSQLDVSGTTYTITASNSGGSINATVFIIVLEVAPHSLSPSSTSMTLTKNVSMTPVTMSVSGGPVSTWAISPSLVAGLSFDTSNGTITGMPTSLDTTGTTYTVTASNSGGSTTATVSIIVNDASPFGLSASNTNLTLRLGEPMTPLTMSVQGGESLVWTVNQSLPSGLSIHNSTGTISGTPIVLDTTGTDYTVSAENSGGSVSISVRITILEVAPTNLTASSEYVELTKGVQMTSITVSSDGGNVSTWAISPTLVSGLSFNTQTGTISGTPTALDTTGTIYTLTATNTGGSDTVEVTIVVLDAAATNLTASESSVVLTKGEAMDAITMSVQGGSVTSWTISPTLPAGLSFDTSNGTISGTPTTLDLSGTIYTINASNSGGYDLTNISITIIDQAPHSLSASDTNLTLTKGVAMTTVTMSLSGGTITNWSIHTPLPTGLSFNSATGSISGTPTVLDTLGTTYIVTASNSGGSVNVSVTITINDVAPTTMTISTSNLSATKSVAITPISFTVNGGDIETWTISPGLPSGLVMNSTTGVISGTPSVLDTQGTSYTITASNSGGSVSGSITITITDVAPYDLSASSMNVTLTQGVAMTSLTMSVSGGPVTSWTISPSLVSGLSFDSSTGTISGTPTSLDTTGTVYTITASNSGGSDTTMVNIVVLAASPGTLTLDNSTHYLQKDVAMTTLTASVSGGTPTSWTIQPALPAGLTFNSNDGSISGTPTVLDTAGTNYTITASNSGGSASAVVWISINHAPVTNLTASTSTLVLTKGSSMTPVSFSAQGGTITSWSISPALPNGLMMNTSTGVISGTPTVLDVAGSDYTITASNSGGAATAVINLTILAQAPDISPSETTATLTKGANMQAISMSNSGGDVVTWTISPSLMSGLSFSTSDGSISGTPSNLDLSGTTYTITASNSGGNSTTQVYIRVVEVAPNLAISDENLVLYSNQSFSESITNSGGSIVTWSITPSLPSGLTFSSGVISGTPTSSASATSYTVTATNSGGSSSVQFNITIVEPTPEIEYSVSSITLTKGTAMQSLSPTNNGGVPNSWTISPTLPAGISFDSQTGELSGTPTALITATSFTITASNNNGSDSYVLSITVNDQAPSISVSPSNYVFTNGSEITNISFTNSGGDVISWTISPSLTSGLSFDTSSGLISGTPDELDTTGTTYTVTASNTGGQSSTTVFIKVNAVAPEISASNLFNAFTNGSSITPITFSNDGGEVVTWTIWPSLPSGLSFDSSNGEISGTPTSLDVSGTNYYVNATNSGGSDSETVEIKITETPISTLTPSSSSVTLTKGVAMSPITMTISGMVDSWTISPSLASGLTFDNSTGEISGTPTILDTSGTNYTVTASNSGGSISTVVHITIIDATPSSLTPSSTSVTLTKGQAMSPITMSISGGPVDTWSISPSLASGLSMNTSTGTISGVPTVLDTTGTTYTVTASNSGGSAQASISITIVDAAPTTLTASDTYVTLTNGTAMTAITTSVNGGPITSWSISPSLPNGLSFDSSNGTISGTPSQLDVSGTTYTITASNSGGSINETVFIIILELAPHSLTPSSTAMTLTKNASMTPVTMTISGGPVSTWTISPSLVSGLTFDTSNGTISGTPTTLDTLGTTYTITASNSGGSTTATVSIIVNDASPFGLSASNTNMTLRLGEPMTPLTMSVVGGESLTWTVDQALPNGLSIHNSTGTISGTPTVLDTTGTDYIVTAENSGGSVNITVRITILEVAPTNLTASSEYVELTKGVQMTSITVSSDGGNVSTWAISPTLVSGLSFNTQTGEITGTPTALDITGTTYTITASNTGGSDTVYLAIVVLDAAATNLTASDSSVVLTKGVAMTGITMSVQGGTVTSWTISPSLPAGLNFNTSSGEITGTPTVLDLNGTIYTINASNSGGFDLANVSISIIDQAPHSLSASNTNLTLTKGVSMTDVTMSVQGGTVTSWTIHTPLATGLSFDSATGTISGTPTVLDTLGTTYIVTASNSGGSVNVSVTITINDVAPTTMTITTSNISATKGVAITPLSPSVDGGDIETWTISPSLPSGLVINSTTGVISGTPSVLDTQGSTYTITASNSGGSVSGTIMITITDVAPYELSASSMNVTLTQGIAMTSLTMSVSGGPVTSWTISPTLVSGLSFDTSTGTISGTPTSLDTTGTVYTITASNSGGSDTTSVNIIVLEVSPGTLSLANSTLYLQKDVAMTTLTASVSGGTPTSWTIQPALPAGLSFNSNDGSISGTPTVLDTAGTNYTITASNSGGSASAVVWISINHAPVSNLVASSSAVTLTLGNAMSPLSFSAQGGTITSWSISPALPSGLMMNTSTGVISGTPTVLDVAGSDYTITASNSGGAATVVVNITILAQAPDIEPSTSTVSVAKGVTMQTITMTNDGGDVVTWTISPALVSGLSFNTADGSISGTPTVLDVSGTTYTINASNSGGYSTTRVHIRVVNVEPSISLDASDFTLYSNHSTSITVSNSGGEIISWNLTPSLPNGLVFNTTTGVISGTPVSSASTTLYTLTATNSGGSSTVQFNITIVETTPEIQYPQSTLLMTMGDTLSGYTVTNTGGVVSTWSISPSLPTGLTLNTNTGEISGTVSVLSTTTTYTVTASNDNGSDTFEFNLTVIDAPPALSQPASTYIFTNGVAITDITFSNSGGAVVTWTITPSLPAGLTFNTTDGTISGTPTVLDVNGTQYTVTASNTGGSESRNMTIIILAAAPGTLTPSSTNITLTLGVQASAITFSYAGDQVQTWSISPALPAGLTMDSANGTISGTPTVLDVNGTTYTINASNSGGSGEATITITILAAAPSLSTTASVEVFTLNSPISPISITNSGGDIVSWNVSPALPAGLSFNTTSGVISGTPTSLDVQGTSYTIIASNSGGSSSVAFTIQVIDVAPILSASNSEVTLTLNVAMNTLSITNSGGDIVNWTITPALPAGLTFNETTGDLTGTPTSLLVNGAYYNFTAENSGGNDSVSIKITIIDSLPTLSYPQQDLVLTVNQSNQELPMLATLNGPGTITSWQVSPALVSGLNFGQSNGTIWGVPDQLQNPALTYQIWANNSGGSSTVNITILVLPEEPTVQHIQHIEVVQSVSFNATVLDYGTSRILGETVEGELPEGLNYSNGVLSGTPVGAFNNTTITILAWNEAGNVTIEFTITSLENFDGDSLPDITDEDDDDDGWSDIDEANCSTNSLDSSSTPIDTDGDGICNVLDSDDDGDNWSDNDEFECNTDSLDDSSTPVDTDGDSICNYLDSDDDGDLWSDSDEVNCSTDSLYSSSTPIDTDGDGICNILDDDDDGDDWSDVQEAECNTDSLDDSSTPIDTDGDSSCNYLDADDDDDSWSDIQEAECSTDSLDSSDVPLDTDSDGTCNVVDSDDDGDGWSDSDEAICSTDSLDDSSIPLDFDGDGICDQKDSDIDNDGVDNDLDIDDYNDQVWQAVSEPTTNEDDDESFPWWIVFISILLLILFILILASDDEEEEEEEDEEEEEEVVEEPEESETESAEEELSQDEEASEEEVAESSESEDVEEAPAEVEEVPGSDESEPATEEADEPEPAPEEVDEPEQSEESEEYHMSLEEAKALLDSMDASAFSEDVGMDVGLSPAAVCALTAAAGELDASILDDVSWTPNCANRAMKRGKISEDKEQQFLVFAAHLFNDDENTHINQNELYAAAKAWNHADKLVATFLAHKQ